MSPILLLSLEWFQQIHSRSSLLRLQLAVSLALK